VQSVLRSLNVVALAVMSLAFAQPVAAQGPAFISLADRFKPQILAHLPDGRNLHFFCQGEGSPVAVMDASLSFWSFEFIRLQPELAKVTKVCAVDRAGFGFSDPGPMPRDVVSDTADLYAGLKASGIPGPYVLVGHSYGGQTARYFAYTHPKDVAGLLLIDPGIEHFGQRLPYPPSYIADAQKYYDACRDLAKAGALKPGFSPMPDEGPCIPEISPKWTPARQAYTAEIFARPSRFEAMASEFATTDTTTSAALDRTRHKLGDLPLIVLSSDKAHFTEDRPQGVDADALHAAWVNAHKEQASDSSIGEERTIDGASHFVFAERPDAVIAAFNEVMTKARAQLENAGRR
jgi:pimeloyl-ACP methyl ester carboxylesterase